MAPTSTQLFNIVLQRFFAALYKAVPRLLEILSLLLFKKSRLNISVSMSIKSKSISKPKSVSAVVLTLVVGSLISSSICDNILRVSDLSLVLFNSISASVSLIIA